MSGRTTTSIARGGNNVATINTLVGKIGILSTWGVIDGQNLETRKFGLLRAFVEIPSVSGRAELTVLEADWERENVALAGA